MPIFKWVLLPLSFLYRLITGFRNHLYNIEYSKSFEFEANVISVGNLSVGGTGKTPMVEYLIRLLSSKYEVATLSRGYGRKTKGFFEASEDSKALDIGDEPLQLFLKYGQSVSVSVIEQRAWGIPNILMNNDNTDIILLDDAYQHRTIKPSFSILLTNYHQPFYDDMILPSGRLRERRKNADRSDVIVVTKCPDSLTIEQQNEMKIRIGKYCNKPVFFASLKHKTPISYFDENSLQNGEKVIIVSGVADSFLYEEYTTENWDVVKHFKFSDHYRYNVKSVKQIVGFAEISGTAIITTEKDFTKLRDFKSEWRNLRIFYLPIEIDFLNNKQTFDQLILGSIKKYNRIDEFDAE